VSNYGHVRSLPHRVAYGSKGATIGKPGGIIAPFWVSNNEDRQGTLAVDLGRGNRFRVSHLVLETFVEPRPEGMVARHWDDDASNNRVSNLVWGTYSENMYDAVRTGHHWQVGKTRCPKDHPLDGVYYRSDGTVRQRYCKTCKRDQKRERVARRKAGLPPRAPGRPKTQ